MSDASGRREARRKKILENSTNRLQKIANVNRENENQNALSNNCYVHDAGPPAKSNAENHVADDEIELTTLYERQSATSSASTINIAFNTSRRRLYFVILLALFSKIMNYVCAPNKFFIPLTQLDVRTVCVESIFVPVFIYETSNLLFFRSPDAEHSFVRLLLIIGNLSLKTASRISYLLNVIIRMAQDLLAYFFLFTVMDLCVQAVHERAAF